MDSQSDRSNSLFDSHSQARKMKAATKATVKDRSRLEGAVSTEQGKGSKAMGTDNKGGKKSGRQETRERGMNSNLL